MVPLVLFIVLYNCAVLSVQYESAHTGKNSLTLQKIVIENYSKPSIFKMY